LEVGGALTALGFAGTAVVAWIGGPHISPAQIIPTLLVQGVGEGLLLTPLLDAVLSPIGADDVGAASGVLSTAQQVGGALGVAVVGVVFFSALGPVGHDHVAPYAHALSAAVVVNLILAGATTALVYALPTRRPTASTL
jgi:MFS family permease